MDTEKKPLAPMQPDPSSQKKASLPPAQLWVGSQEHIHEELYTFLRQQFCPHGACNVCTVCKQIVQHQYHGATWITPEKQYTLDHLQAIFSQISLQQEHNQKLFFILDKADFLTTACANRLLKPLEEPPPGYHFILLAHHEKNILPTISSRCTLHRYNKTINLQTNPLSTVFTTIKRHDPSDFLTLLTTAAPHERDSVELLNELLDYWISHATTAYKNGQHREYATAQTIITQLHTALKKPPMPGSSKLFWKNLFMQIMPR